MKPKPFSSLNHLTVPVVRIAYSCWFSNSRSATLRVYLHHPHLPTTRLRGRPSRIGAPRTSGDRSERSPMDRLQFPCREPTDLISDSLGCLPGSPTTHGIDDMRTSGTPSPPMAGATVPPDFSDLEPDAVDTDGRPDQLLRASRGAPPWRRRTMPCSACRSACRR